MVYGWLAYLALPIAQWMGKAPALLSMRATELQDNMRAAGFEILTEPVTVETEVLSSLPQTLSSRQDRQEQSQPVTLDETKIRVLQSPGVLTPVLDKLKLRYPDRVQLIRGNHESRAVTQVRLIYEVTTVMNRNIERCPLYRHMVSTRNAYENMDPLMCGRTLPICSISSRCLSSSTTRYSAYMAVCTFLSPPLRRCLRVVSQAFRRPYIQ